MQTCRRHTVESFTNGTAHIRDIHTELTSVVMVNRSCDNEEQSDM